jgi:hypothetical protein
LIVQQRLIETIQIGGGRCDAGVASFPQAIATAATRITKYPRLTSLTNLGQPLIDVWPARWKVMADSGKDDVRVRLS